MIQVHAFTFYSLIALSAMGLIQAAYVVFFAQREQPENSPFNKPNAPTGFTWVLMTEAEAEARAQMQSAGGRVVPH